MTRFRESEMTAVQSEPKGVENSDVLGGPNLLASRAKSIPEKIPISDQTISPLLPEPVAVKSHK